MDESERNAEIAALRLKGADRLDPVRFHFIEALTRRSLQYEGAIKRLLDDKLGLAVAAYRERFERAQIDAEKAITRTREPARQEQRSPLAELARHISQHSPENDAGLADDIGSRAELRAIRNFRNTWSRLSVDKQLRQAIEQAPENAGPLNSHGLVLQSLATMRDISPDYLERFMSYADSLLWLDQAARKNKPMLKKLASAKTTKS